MTDRERIDARFDSLTADLVRVEKALRDLVQEIHDALSEVGHGQDLQLAPNE